MKTPWISAGAVLAAVVLIGSAAGTVAGAHSVAPDDAAASESAAVAASALVSERTSTFTLAESEGTATVAGARVIAAAPDASSRVQVVLDHTSIEQYWLWAAGVQVTAHGLTPGATARVGITLASGVTKQWAPVTVDADGTLVTTVRTLDVDPENTRPDAGLAQITVTSDVGEVGSALLDVTGSVQGITVSSDPATISQDAFLDSSVTVHATGFEPLTKVFFNLGMPDTTTFAVGENEGLHADENGNFSYELTTATVNSQVGAWQLSFVSSDFSRSGSGSLTVTPGAERVADKTLTPATPEISAQQFSTEPGLHFSVAGFLPFDTYELALTTSRGYTSPLGISRTNGEGRHSNAVKSPSGVPEGEYRLTARSTTTGHYAVGTFRVTGNPSVPESDIALSPSTITAGALADPAAGVLLTGTGIAPGTTFRVSLRDGGWQRQPLLVGADAYATIGDDGRLSLPLVTLETLPVGTYTVWVDAGGGVAAYNQTFPLQVTAASTPDAAPSAPGTPSASVPQARLAPVTVAPALPLAPVQLSTPSSQAPEPTRTPAPGPFDDDAPLPALPVPTSPAL